MAKEICLAIDTNSSVTHHSPLSEKKKSCVVKMVSGMEKYQFVN